MRYILSTVVASVALCAAISSGHGKVTLEDQLSPKKDNDDPKSLGLPSEDGSLLKSGRSQVAFRQKRSLWTDIIKHMTSAIENLYMKPLLVEGVNDAGEFGQKMKDKVRFSSKPAANVMFQENKGRSVGSKLRIPEEYFENSNELDKQKKMSGSDVMRQIHTLQFKSYDATSLQTKIIEELIELDKSLTQDEILKLYGLNLNSVKAKDILNNFFKIKPSIKQSVLERISQIKKSRKEIEGETNKLLHYFGTHIDDDDFTKMTNYLTGIVEENFKWLYPEKSNKSRTASKELRQMWRAKYHKLDNW